MQNATLKGDFKTARQINDRLSLLHKALFIEPSPAPIKYACSLLGICSEEVRLPLTTMTDAGKEKVRAALRAAGFNIH